jgi:curved DNA-binding protein CbpA
MTIERDAYLVLQVDPLAHADVIRAAFRALARLCHPDGSAPDVAQMAELNGAYDRVKTPEVRRHYDRERPRLVAVGPGPAAPIYDAWPDHRPAPVVPVDGTSILDFGRYSGWRLCDIARVDPDYLRWLSRHSTGIRFREAIARSLPGDHELGRRANVLG